MSAAYLLLGPEEGEKAQFIENTLSGIAKRQGEKPELHRYYAFESTMTDVIANLRNGSLFSRHKAIIFDNIEQIKAKADLALLADYLNNPSDNSTLFLVSSVVKGISRTIEKALSPRDKKIFWEMYEDKKIDWIRGFFRQRKIAIDQEAASYLLEMIENNTRDLRDQCAKLAQFFGENSQLHLETIEKYIYHSREENVFTLFDRIATRDLAASQEILSKILLSRESDPSALLSGLLWQIRKLQKLKMLIAKNYPLDEIFAKLNIRNRKGQKIYLTAHKSFTKTDVRSLITLINDFTVRVRSASQELGAVLLQLFVYYAVVRGGRIPSIEGAF
jgi:DNA polymerase-3 subunit delta